MDSNSLYGAALSVGSYAFYKLMQKLYHRYYLRSNCRDDPEAAAGPSRTLEISVIDSCPTPTAHTRERERSRERGRSREREASVIELPALAEGNEGK